VNSDVHLVISSANAAASRLYREGPTYGIIVISSILRKVSHGPMVIYTAGRGRELTKSNCFSRFSVMLKCWPAEEVEVVDRRMLEGQMLGSTTLGYIINYSDMPGGAIRRAQSVMCLGRGTSSDLFLYGIEGKTLCVVL